MENEFSGLILGFSSAALHYLGGGEDQGGKPSEESLILAKQNIDYISMLKDKTTGNLTDEETALIDQVLLDLQLKYIEACKKG